jgi:hypothetical protein
MRAGVEQGVPPAGGTPRSTHDQSSPASEFWYRRHRAGTISLSQPASSRRRRWRNRYDSPTNSEYAPAPSIDPAARRSGSTAKHLGPVGKPQIGRDDQRQSFMHG